MEIGFLSLDVGPLKIPGAWIPICVVLLAYELSIDQLFKRIPRLVPWAHPGGISKSETSRSSSCIMIFRSISCVEFWLIKITVTDQSWGRVGNGKNSWTQPLQVITFRLWKKWNSSPSNVIIWYRFTYSSDLVICVKRLGLANGRLLWTKIQ